MSSPNSTTPRQFPVFPRPRRRRIGLRILLTLLILLLTLAAGFFGHMYYEAHPPAVLPPFIQSMMDGAAELLPVGRSAAVSVGHIEEIIQPASDLITTRYYYTDADIFEDYKQLLGYRLPFTTNKTVFTYEGVVGIGFDLSDVGIEVDAERKMIVLSLPAEQIVSNEIDADSFRYYDVTSSVFNETEMGDITELINVLKKKTAERVIQDPALLEQAQNNAEQILLGFLRASELTQAYTVNFRHG